MLPRPPPKKVCRCIMEGASLCRRGCIKPRWHIEGHFIVPKSIFVWGHVIEGASLRRRLGPELFGHAQSECLHNKMGA